MEEESPSGIALPAPSGLGSGGYRWLQKLRENDRYGGRALVYRHIDAEGLVVGRLAAVLSRILTGKHKPTYEPSTDDGDVIVVTNADKVQFTGKKWQQKVYRYHTGFPGGLKETTARKLWEKDPLAPLRKAVSGMLPKNLLRRHRMRKLLLYAGPKHDLPEHVPLAPIRMPSLWKEKQASRRSRRAASEDGGGSVAPEVTISQEDALKKYGIDLPDDLYPAAKRER